MEVLRREFKGYTDGVEKSMTLFKDQNRSRCIQIQIQDSGIKTIFFKYTIFFVSLFFFNKIEDIQGWSPMKQKLCAWGRVRDE